MKLRELHVARWLTLESFQMPGKGRGKGKSKAPPLNLTADKPPLPTMEEYLASKAPRPAEQVNTGSEAGLTSEGARTPDSLSPPVADSTSPPGADSPAPGAQSTLEEGPLSAGAETRAEGRAPLLPQEEMDIASSVGSLSVSGEDDVPDRHTPLQDEPGTPTPEKLQEEPPPPPKAVSQASPAPLQHEAEDMEAQPSTAKPEAQPFWSEEDRHKGFFDTKKDDEALLQLIASRKARLAKEAQAKRDEKDRLERERREAKRNAEAEARRHARAQEDLEAQRQRDLKARARLIMANRHEARVADHTAEEIREEEAVMLREELELTVKERRRRGEEAPYMDSITAAINKELRKQRKHDRKTVFNAHLGQRQADFAASKNKDSREFGVYPDEFVKLNPWADADHREDGGCHAMAKEQLGLIKEYRIPQEPFYTLNYQGTSNAAIAFLLAGDPIYAKIKGTPVEVARTPMHSVLMDLSIALGCPHGDVGTLQRRLTNALHATAEADGAAQANEMLDTFEHFLQERLPASAKPEQVAYIRDCYFKTGRFLHHLQATMLAFIRTGPRREGIAEINRAIRSTRSPAQLVIFYKPTQAEAPFYDVLARRFLPLGYCGIAHGFMSVALTGVARRVAAEPELGQVRDLKRPSPAQSGPRNLAQPTPGEAKAAGHYRHRSPLERRAPIKDSEGFITPWYARKPRAPAAEAGASTSGQQAGPSRDRSRDSSSSRSDAKKARKGQQ